MRKSFLLFLLCSFVLALAAPTLRAQESPCDADQRNSFQPATLPQMDQPGYPAQARTDTVAAEIKQNQIKARNQERQSSLKKDTDKLLQLATELKQQVDKTNEHVLSLDVIRKAEAIEKLAKSVRDKMKANGYCDFAGQ